MPIGSLSGSGAVPAVLPQLNVSVSATSVTPVFVPVVTISGNDKVLAGIPTITQLSVTAGSAAVHTAIGLVGVGIVRGSSTFLVDDQLTPFVAGNTTDNVNVDEGDPIYLPAVGETLQDGDQVGLLFYQEQVQYATIVSAPGLEGSPGVVSLINGQMLPTPVTSILNPVQNIGVDPNPYTVSAAGVALPILVPGTFPGSRLSSP